MRQLVHRARVRVRDGAARYDADRRLMQSIAGRLPEGVSFGLESFNGAPGIVARLHGMPVSAMAVSVSDGRVQSLQLVANPAKLTQLASGTTIPML